MADQGNNLILPFHFHQYILNKSKQIQLGYPIEDIDHPGYAFIYKRQFSTPRKSPSLRHHEIKSVYKITHKKEKQQQPLNANASEFVPRNNKCSGLVKSSHFLASLTVEHCCVRCSKKFLTDRNTGEYLTTDMCEYHWGKKCDGRNSAILWDCCEGSVNSPGCTRGSLHVWTGLIPGTNGPFDGYVSTRPANVTAPNGDYGIYALDCEMCYTKNGLELTRVTVVNLHKEIVYDTLVRPDVQVIDYNTRFSGITEEMLSYVEKNIRDVQEDLLSFINTETIIIGHGLENDLRALKLLHPTIVDTSVIFPRKLGYGFKDSLKNLAKEFLNEEIQAGQHDSAEDAKIVVDLMVKEIVDNNYKNTLVENVSEKPVSRKRILLPKNSDIDRMHKSSRLPNFNRNLQSVF